MSNTGTATGTKTTSSDSSLATCQITGYIKDLGGSVVKGYTFYVRHIYSPLLDGTSLIFQERIKLTTDKNGRVRFNLIKKAQFKIEFPDNLSYLSRICTVPNVASADLADVVFPRASSLDFESPTLSMSVNGTQTLKVTATMTDGTTEKNVAGVTITSSNSSVAEVSGSNITAKGTGTVTVSITNYDPEKIEISDNLYSEQIVRLNRITPAFDSITITVS